MRQEKREMNHLIDISVLFLISFLCFFIPFKFFNKKNNNEEGEKYDDALNRRLIAISKQQDMLLESANEHISTFVKLEHEELGGNNSAGSMFDRIRIIMKKAGISNMSVNTFIMLCSIGGIVFAALIIHFKFLNLILGIPVGYGVGAYLVFVFLASQAEKKKMEFLQQFPDAIDMMIRGVKAGLNINRIMKLVSMEAKDPLATEYRIISQKFDLGIEPEKVLVEAADKIDLEEFRFLVVALVLQMENGGVLAEILQNLSSIVRKRLELGLKLKAMSAEARMSAIVISALPFVFAGIMMVVNPDHLKEFTKPGSGQTMLRITITLFSLGTFFMLRATKIKV